MENDKLLDAFRDICRKEGSVCLVGPDSYSHFAELSDTEMETGGQCAKLGVSVQIISFL